VAEGIRFTGLVGRDAADDDRRTGLVFLEREVATRTSTTSNPRMLQLLLVVDLNAETAIFSSSSSSGLSVCLLSSYFFPQKKKIPMSCIHTHNNNNNNNNRAKAKSRLLLPTSYYHRLSSRAKERRSAISLSLSLSLSLAGCPLLLLLCSYPCWAGISKTLHKVILYKYWPECQSFQGTYRGIPESENRQFRFFEYSAVREPSFPAP
jgi:hypothetical protein